jgi:hypothetical protein
MNASPLFLIVVSGSTDGSSMVYLASMLQPDSGELQQQILKKL